MSQDRKFVAAVVENLPDVAEDVKQRWIENPRGLQEALREALCPLRWREENGVIYFSVISDGTTGKEWIKRLEKKGFRVEDRAKSVLLSPDFHPTRGVTTEVAVLMGALFRDSNRVTSNIREDADKRKLTNPNAEVACLIREMFLDEELEAMGLWWIVVFHEPIKDSDGDPSLLSARRYDDVRWLNACCGGPGFGWNSYDSFAFAVSQVSS